jgi:hypothetical protein
VQTSHKYQYGTGTNQSLEYTLNREQVVHFPDPATGTTASDHPCPCCGNKVNFQVTSVEEAARSADFTRSIANVTVWALVAVPLVAVFLAVRYFTGAYADGPFPPLDIWSIIAAVVLAIVGLTSFYLRSDSYRASSLLPESRVALNFESIDHHLWRESDMSTKGVRLELNHRLLKVEGPSG